MNKKWCGEEEVRTYHIIAQLGNIINKIMIICFSIWQCQAGY